MCRDGEFAGSAHDIMHRVFIGVLREDGERGQDGGLEREFNYRKV